MSGSTLRTASRQSSVNVKLLGWTSSSWDTAREMTPNNASQKCRWAPTMAQAPSTISCLHKYQFPKDTHGV